MAPLQSSAKALTNPRPSFSKDEIASVAGSHRMSWSPRITVRQRAQQHAVHYRKVGRIGADTHGQAQHGHGCESPLAQQGSESVANVVPHGFGGRASGPKNNTFEGAAGSERTERIRQKRR